MLSKGAFSSAELSHLGKVHPFTRQLDVVFPSSDEFEKALSQLCTSYCRAQLSLSELHEFASNITGPGRRVNISIASVFLAVPNTTECNDTWCIDQRGVLTLCVSKTLYEQLGLVGRKMPFKGCPEQYVASAVTRAQEKAALLTWDNIWAQSGFGKWDVVYHGGISASGDGAAVHSSHSHVQVEPRIQRSVDVHVPIPALALVRENHLKDAEDAEETEEWQDRTSELYEWVGLACLGAQRLKANDRVDPYVGVYDAPSPSCIGSITHLCWKGLLDPVFTQSVIDTSIALLTNASAQNDTQTFIAITRHAYPQSPVSFIPPSGTTAEPGISIEVQKEVPLRVPRADSEDTSCLILTPFSDGELSKDDGIWVMAESVGQWDARWG
ncbi:hypothetical protein BV22DRAFT_1107313 [Leucogyrophana mollusca]|uniref:Uncharacterized protein n=1 Tax=Leucogyrophana mollusca TaxID=85980 RepID=A0ACB8B6Q8_9AGAM|nr:hypothetical protein BV22DRAFT_1107313 [Leucogyrophana mollusca]